MKRDPLFDTAWKESRELAADVIADRLLYAHEGISSVSDAMGAKILSDNIRSVAAWRNPRRYSPKQQIEVSHTVDLSAALNQAETRIKPALEEKNRKLIENHQWPPFDPVRDARERAHRDDLIERARHQAKMDNRIAAGEVIEAELSPSVDKSVDNSVVESDSQNVDSKESLKPGFRDTTLDDSSMISSESVTDEMSSDGFDQFV